jgi:hypothetical protein
VPLARHSAAKVPTLTLLAKRLRLCSPCSSTASASRLMNSAVVAGGSGAQEVGGGVGWWCSGLLVA